MPQLLAAAGMDKRALEEQLAQREEQHLVAEFRRALEYNLGKVGMRTWVVGVIGLGCWFSAGGRVRTAPGG